MFWRGDPGEECLLREEVLKWDLPSKGEETRALPSPGCGTIWEPELRPP